MKYYNFHGKSNMHNIINNKAKSSKPSPQIIIIMLVLMIVMMVAVMTYSNNVSGL